MNPTRDEMRTMVVQVIRAVSDIDLMDVPPDSDLFDIGVDSLEFASIIVELEEALDRDLPPEAFDAFADLSRITLDDVVTALMTPGALTQSHLP